MHRDAVLPTQVEHVEALDAALKVLESMPVDRKIPKNYLPTLVRIINRRPALIRVVATRLQQAPNATSSARLIRVLASEGSHAAQDAIIHFFDDMGNTRESRIDAVGALSFISNPSPRLIDMLERLTFDHFARAEEKGDHHSDAPGQFARVSYAAPAVLGSVVHGVRAAGDPNGDAHRLSERLQEAAWAALKKGDASSHQQLAWLFALGNDGNPDHLPLLRRYIASSPHRAARVEALSALRQQDQHAAESVLMDALGDQDAHVRRAAITGLVRDFTPSAKAIAALHDLAGREKEPAVLDAMKEARFDPATKSTFDKFMKIVQEQKSRRGGATPLALLEVKKPITNEAEGGISELKTIKGGAIVDTLKAKLEEGPDAVKEYMASLMSQSWEKKIGSDSANIVLYFQFGLAFESPWAMAEAGMKGTALGKNFNIFNFGLQYGQVCEKASKKTKSKLLPYLTIFKKKIMVGQDEEGKTTINKYTDGECKKEDEEQEEERKKKEEECKSANPSTSLEDNDDDKEGGKNTAKPKQGDDGEPEEVTAARKKAEARIQAKATTSEAPPKKLTEDQRTVGINDATTTAKPVVTVGKLADAQLAPYNGGGVDGEGEEDDMLSTKQTTAPPKSTATQSSTTSCGSALVRETCIKLDGCAWKILKSNGAAKATAMCAAIGRSQISADGDDAAQKVSPDGRRRLLSMADKGGTTTGIVKDEKKKKKKCEESQLARSLARDHPPTLTPTCGEVDFHQVFEHETKITAVKLAVAVGPFVASFTVEFALTLSIGGAFSFCDNAPVEWKGLYSFLFGVEPGVGAGIIVTGAVGIPGLLEVGVDFDIDFVYVGLPMSMAFASNKGRRLFGGKGAVENFVTAGDLVVRALKGSISVYIMFFPDVNLIETRINIVSINFPGVYPKFACVSTAFKSSGCPDRYFINAPGEPGFKGTISTVPLNLWCTRGGPRAPKHSDGSKLCDWAADAEVALDTDQTNKYENGGCAQSYHCWAQNFDGTRFDNATTTGVGGPLEKSAKLRDFSNYGPDSDQKNYPYKLDTNGAPFTTEIAGGVDRPITSSIRFVVKREKNQAGMCGRVAFSDAESRTGYEVQFGTKCGTRTRIIKHGKEVKMINHGPAVMDVEEPGCAGADADTSICHPNTKGVIELWATVNTFGVVTFGVGETPGEDVWGMWEDAVEDALPWVTHAGVGAADGQKIHYNTVDINRGLPTESYCYKNKGKEQGRCYRQMPDSYTPASAKEGNNAHKQGALRCHKNQHEACLSGICKNFAFALTPDRRCAGCNGDVDCEERTYVGTECDITTPVVAKLSHWGKFTRGKIIDLHVDGRVLLDTAKGKWVSRKHIHPCDSGSAATYASFTDLPAACRPNCLASSAICPLVENDDEDAADVLHARSPARCRRSGGKVASGTRPACLKKQYFIVDGKKKEGTRQFYCKARAAPGQYCEEGTDCQSGLCYKDQCSSGMYGSKCPYAKANNCQPGLYCDLSDRCRDGRKGDWCDSVSGGKARSKCKVRCSRLANVCRDGTYEDVCGKDQDCRLSPVTGNQMYCSGVSATQKKCRDGRESNHCMSDDAQCQKKTAKGDLVCNTKDIKEWKVLGVTQGGRCYLAQWLKHGSACGSTAHGAARCPAGNHCSAMGVETKRCRDGRPGDWCKDDSQCQGHNGLVCDKGPWGASFTNTCVKAKYRARGAYCDHRRADRCASTTAKPAICFQRTSVAKGTCTDGREGDSCLDGSHCQARHHCSGPDITNKRCWDGSSGDHCTTDSNCKSGLVCDKGKWGTVSTNKCAAEQQMSHGELCDHRRVQRCVGNGVKVRCDQPASQISSGHCVDGRENDRCSSANECKAGHHCSGADLTKKTCWDGSKGDHCTTDSNCNDGLVCDKGAWGTVSTNKCVSVQHRAHGQSCDDRRAQRCKRSGDSSKSMWCKSGECRDGRNGDTCDLLKKDGECQADHYCMLEYLGVKGKCRDGSPGSHCRDDHQCQDDTICFKRTAAMNYCAVANWRQHGESCSDRKPDRCMKSHERSCDAPADADVPKGCAGAATAAACAGSSNPWYADCCSWADSCKANSAPGTAVRLGLGGHCKWSKCADGREGDRCDVGKNDGECKAGLHCSSGSGIQHKCSDGSKDDHCTEDGDCMKGLVCDKSGVNKCLPVIWANHLGFCDPRGHHRCPTTQCGVLEKSGNPKGCEGAPSAATCGDSSSNRGWFSKCCSWKDSACVADDDKQKESNLVDSKVRCRYVGSTLKHECVDGRHDDRCGGDHDCQNYCSGSLPSNKKCRDGHQGDHCTADSQCSKDGADLVCDKRGSNSCEVAVYRKYGESCQDTGGNRCTSTTPDAVNRCAWRECVDGRTGDSCGTDSDCISGDFKRCSGTGKLVGKGKCVAGLHGEGCRNSNDCAGEMYCSGSLPINKKCWDGRRGDRCFDGNFNKIAIAIGSVLTGGALGATVGAIVGVADSKKDTDPDNNCQDSLVKQVCDYRVGQNQCVAVDWKDTGSTCTQKGPDRCRLRNCHLLPTKSASKTLCFSAAKAQYGDKVAKLVTGSWEHVPSGCSVASGKDWAALYNTGTAGTKSTDDYTTVTTTASEATCLKASLAEYGAKVTARRKFLSKGSWGHVPPGCTVQSGGDWAAHYNTGTGRPTGGGYSQVKEMTEIISGCPAEMSKAACEGGSTQGFNAKCCKWATRGTPQNICHDVAKKKYGALFKAGGLVTGSWSHVPGGCSIRHAGRVIPQTEATCLKASLAEYGAKVTARRNYLAKGSWGHVPPGCTVQSGGDWAAHYNRRGTGRPNGGYSPVKAAVDTSTVGRVYFNTWPGFVFETTCLAAATDKFGSKVTKKRPNLVAGSWRHVPAGCSVQAGGDWAAHFNRNSKSTAAEGSDGESGYVRVRDRSAATRSLDWSSVDDDHCVADSDKSSKDGYIRCNGLSKCVDGQWGSSCRNDDDCDKTESPKMRCNGKFQCVDGRYGSSCRNTADCQNTGSYVGKPVRCNGLWQCMDGRYGSTCRVGKSDCQSGMYCKGTFAPKCYDGRVGNPCTSDSQCSAKNGKDYICDRRVGVNKCTKATWRSTGNSCQDVGYLRCKTHESRYNRCSGWRKCVAGFPGHDCARDSDCRPVYTNGRNYARCNGKKKCSSGSHGESCRRTSDCRPVNGHVRCNGYWQCQDGRRGGTCRGRRAGAGDCQSWKCRSYRCH